MTDKDEDVLSDEGLLREVAPLLDHSSITTMNARKAIFEALTGIAMRKQGIKGPNYLDPVASGQVSFPLE